MYEYAFLPVRLYYRCTRWLFGNSYDPFDTKIEQGLHPIIAFYRNYNAQMRLVMFGMSSLFPVMLMVLTFIRVRPMAPLLLQMHSSKHD
jgi:hypothetical protein